MPILAVEAGPAGEEIGLGCVGGWSWLLSVDGGAQDQEYDQEQRLARPETAGKDACVHWERIGLRLTSVEYSPWGRGVRRKSEEMKKPTGGGGIYFPVIYPLSSCYEARGLHIQYAKFNDNWTQIS